MRLSHLLRHSATAWLLAAPAIAAAHHSFAAHFLMDQFTEVQGRVTQIQWVNPHIKIYVEDASGATWEVEAGPVNLLERMGIARDTMAVGDTIRARGNPGRNDEHLLWVSNILLADNTELLAAPGSEPYWGSKGVGDASKFFEAGELALPAGGERSFYRVWSPLISNFPRPKGDPSLTAAGQAAQSRYGIDRQAVADCEVPGMPFAMMSPYPIAFENRGDRILIRGEAYDLVRTAWLAPQTPVPAPSAEGYSLAHFEGDTLVIETSRIDYHSYGDLGPAQSDQSHVVERFTLSPDGLNLAYEVVITDPVMLAAPWTWGGNFIYREDAAIRPWNCQAD